MAYVGIVTAHMGVNYMEQLPRQLGKYSIVRPISL